MRAAIAEGAYLQLCELLLIRPASVEISDLVGHGKRGWAPPCALPLLHLAQWWRHRVAAFAVRVVHLLVVLIRRRHTRM